MDNADKAAQSIKNVKAGGPVNQQSDVPSTTQKIESTESPAGVSQQITSKEPSISVGRFSGKGAIAVVAVVLIVVIYAIVKIATS